jgi:hypothetical protein
MSEPAERLARYARRKRRQGLAILAFIAFFILWDVVWLGLGTRYWWIFAISLVTLVLAAGRMLHAIGIWKEIENVMEEEQ